MTSPSLPNLDHLDEAERGGWVEAYLDGALSPEDALAVGNWLAAHPDRWAAVEAQRRLWDLLGADSDEPAPAGFVDAACRAAGPWSHRSSWRRARGSGVPRWAWAAAATLVLGLGAAFGLRARLSGREPHSAPANQHLAALSILPPEVLRDEAYLDVLMSLEDETFEALFDLEAISTPSDPSSAGDDQWGG